MKEHFNIRPTRTHEGAMLEPCHYIAGGVGASPVFGDGGPGKLSLLLSQTAVSHEVD